MKIGTTMLLLCIPLLSQAADDVTARRNFGTELAGCSAYYGARAGAPGISKQDHDDLGTKSHTALKAAASVTNNQFALTKEAEAQAKPEAINGALCDQVMAHPNERFAYWRGR